MSQTQTVREQPRELEQTTGCPECTGSLQEDGIETVCSDCGLVVDIDAIDHGPEWRAFTASEKNSRERTGEPRTERRHDHGLGSQISWDETDGRINRQRQYHSQARFQGRFQRNLAEGLNRVLTICSRIDADDSLTDRSCRIFRNGHEAGLAQGRSLEQLAATAVYVAIREQGPPLSARDLAPYTDIEPNDIYQLKKRLDETLEVDQDIVQPVEHVAPIASSVDFPETARQYAEAICRKIESDGLHTGQKPQGIAAAAVYVAGRRHGPRVNQQDVTDDVDVTTPTLRKRYHDIMDAGIPARVEAEA